MIHYNEKKKQKRKETVHVYVLKIKTHLMAAMDNQGTVLALERHLEVSCVVLHSRTIITGKIVGTDIDKKIINIEYK